MRSGEYWHRDQVRLLAGLPVLSRSVLAEHQDEIADDEHGDGQARRGIKQFGRQPAGGDPADTRLPRPRRRPGLPRRPALQVDPALQAVPAEPLRQRPRHEGRHGRGRAAPRVGTPSGREPRASSPSCAEGRTTDVPRADFVYRICAASRGKGKREREIMGEKKTTDRLWELRARARKSTARRSRENHLYIICKTVQQKKAKCKGVAVRAVERAWCTAERVCRCIVL